MMSAVLRMEESKNTDNVLRSLHPEVEEGMNRVDVEILTDLPGIKIEAKDSRALRAAVNSYLRWIDISDQIRCKFIQ